MFCLCDNVIIFKNGVGNILVNIRLICLLKRLNIRSLCRTVHDFDLGLGIKITKSDLCGRNSLIYCISDIAGRSECIRIGSHIHSLCRLYRLLGDNKSVKASDRLYRLELAENCRGGLKRIDEYGIGSIPFSIVKILVKLNRPLTFLILMNFISVLHSMRYKSGTDDYREEGNHKEYKFEE